MIATAKVKNTLYEIAIDEATQRIRIFKNAGSNPAIPLASWTFHQLLLEMLSPDE
jgi:hypothetical protein